MKKYNTIWDKISADIKNQVNSKPVCNKKVLKTKTKSYSDEATDFQDREVPKVDTNYTCLTVTSLDYVLKIDENYYLQMSLKECKYIKKSNWTYDFLEDLENSPDDSDED